jgi:hypothetical protein
LDFVVGPGAGAAGMRKPWGGFFLAVGSMAAMNSPAAHSSQGSYGSQGSNLSFSSVGNVVSRSWAPAIAIVLVAFSSQSYHIPLIRRMNEIQRKMPPPPPFPKGTAATMVKQEELIKWEGVAVSWHDKMWAFRGELIESLPFCSMDDEVTIALLRQPNP